MNLHSYLKQLVLLPLNALHKDFLTPIAEHLLEKESSKKSNNMLHQEILT